MNILSLFDGMACGLVALKRAGIKVDNYYASEIDKYAIQIAKKNHPEIQHVGSVEDYKTWNLPKIDLIIGGSPCQGFSFAGKQLNFDDPRSALFFKFVECVWKFKPDHFLMENVKMKKEYSSAISELLEVDRIEINSSLLSAQNRQRLYWFNWDADQPEDKNILLKNILESPGTGVLKNHGEWREKNDKSNCIDANYFKGVDNHAQRTCIQVGLKDGQAHEIGRRIYSEEGKMATLMANNAGGTIHKLVGTSKNDFRKLTPIECERLQTLPDNYTEGVSNTQRYKMIGNGWTVDVIAHILRGL